MASQAEIARQLDLSQPAMSKFLAEANIPRGPDGYDSRLVTQAYIRRLRASAAGRTAEGDGLDLAQERARLASLQADAQDLKNRERRGELVEQAAVTAAWIAILARVRSRLLAIPPRAAPVLAQTSSAAAVQAKLKEFVHEALTELAATEVVTSTGEDEIAEQEDPAAEAIPDKPSGGGDKRRRKAIAKDDGATAAPDRKRVGRPVPDAVPRGQRRTRKVVNRKS